MNINTLTIDKIFSFYEKMGYTFFTNGNYNMNNGAIRSINTESDKFDDIYFQLYKVNTMWKLDKYLCTTDPGKHWLFNPMNVNGTSIVMKGQHFGTHKLGYHRNSYLALVQKKELPYVRDNNRDSKLDFSLFEDEKNIKYGIQGFNHHRASEWKTLFNVGKYSAGCTVIQNPQEYSRFINNCKRQIIVREGNPNISINDILNSKYNSFTYTLFEEKDLI